MLMALKMMLWFRSKLLQGTTDSSLAGVDRSVVGGGHHHHHGVKKQQQPFSFVTQEVRWMIVGLYGNGIEAIIMV